ncbi:MAG TPA: hypothetical protein V6D11_02180 [Waterburya sp.]
MLAFKNLEQLAYRIEYSPESEVDLQYLTARQQAILLDAVDQQLNPNWY